ncbi:MAG: hypothetical protein R2880_04205 [Deinococcales bacterium]
MSRSCVQGSHHGKHSHHRIELAPIQFQEASSKIRHGIDKTTRNIAVIAASPPPE